MGKDKYLVNVLGADVFREIREAKVLLVGAGGIGCELLKDLVLMGYGEIHIVDLDTIDLSNLNRQFLFRHKDIKKPKATTAVNAVHKFNVHRSKLVSYMANIMDTEQFPLDWFDQFKFIFNALDNIQARSYVNKMCLFLQKPSIESGTTGFNGQVTPIFPYRTECYECTVKETPKTYPVCTIRSTPSQPVHCVTWAKNYLFGQLFGESEDDDLSSRELGTDNQQEIQNLIKEHNELLELKQHVRDAEFFDKIIEKIFVKDINKLLALEDLWKTRARPVPLEWSPQYRETVLQHNDADVSKGEQVWPVEKYIYLLMKSVKALQTRLAQHPDTPLSFDKDDEDTLDFVVAAANIRSAMFHIPIKSKFDIKQIAGNIIPAIATTNSVISGYSALQSLFMFKSDPRKHSKMVYTFQDATRFMSASLLYESNPDCKSCSIPRSTLRINLDDSSIVLADVLREIVALLGYHNEDDVSLILGADRLIYDSDFDDNKDVNISKLGFSQGKILSVNDENDEKQTIELYIENCKDEKSVNLDKIVLPPKPVTKPQEEPKKSPSAASLAPVPENAAIVISDDEDELVPVQTTDGKEELVPVQNGAARKHKIDESSDNQPAKKQKKAEDDSIVILD